MFSLHKRSENRPNINKDELMLLSVYGRNLQTSEFLLVNVTDMLAAYVSTYVSRILLIIMSNHERVRGAIDLV